jgi:hypothetical protein
MTSGRHDVCINVHISTPQPFYAQVETDRASEILNLSRRAEHRRVEMRRLIIVLGVAIALPLCARLPGDDKRGEWQDIKSYDSVVSDKALKRSPSWKSDAENPPLPARTALKLAITQKESHRSQTPAGTVGAERQR